MRAYIFTFLFFLVMGLKPIDAQEKISFGLSSQIQSTRLVINGSGIRSKKIWRPTSLLFTEYKFYKRTAVHIGLGYALMTPNSDVVKNDFHYLTMPLYLKHGGLKEGKKLGLIVFYGANFKYLLKAQHTSLNGDKTNIREHIRPIQWGFVLGGGLEFRLSNNLSLETLPSFSIGSILNKANPASMVVRNTNTRFILNLKYKFK